VTTYKSGNHLFKNRGDATFEDVTKQANVGYVGHSNSAVFFDYDLDGYLDLYLCNIGSFTTETINEQAGNYVGVALDFQSVAADTNRLTPGENDVLWHNKGDGTFEDVTAKAGVTSPSWNGDCAVADYDGDGDLDLYVANMFGPNHLFRNNGDGTFTDVADELLGKTTWGAIGCRFFDADNDGRFDLYVVDMHSDMWVDLKNPNARDEIDPKAKYMTPFGPRIPGPKAATVTGKLDKLEGKVIFGNSFFHKHRRQVRGDVRQGRPRELLAVGDRGRGLRSRRPERPVRHGGHELPVLLLAELSPAQRRQPALHRPD
jgi:hypothetical protein